MKPDPSITGTMYGQRPVLRVDASQCIYEQDWFLTFHVKTIGCDTFFPLRKIGGVMRHS
ncbi:hypothetical protein CSUI_006466 [Cystoisospora suis]|uniref:Uncharacterized protein n=1 Tax=Cystoisospora suis TaxID=483139 RepID=A0A2C6KGS9_9APIC|nr:hypothetical protein CSUI_006466 [Cystoisospora suis]